MTESITVSLNSFHRVKKNGWKLQLNEMADGNQTFELWVGWSRWKSGGVLTMFTYVLPKRGDEDE